MTLSDLITWIAETPYLFAAVLVLTFGSFLSLAAWCESALGLKREG